MKTPMSLALLSFVPVTLLALVFPQMLASLITAAVIGEIGFLIPVSNRLVELKRERGSSVPFRERYPLLLTLAGYLCYAEIGLGSPSELFARVLAVAGAAAFAASKLWLGKGKLWPFRSSAATS
jgi:hypothetical protein